jgi:hypothetical protein
MGSAVGDGIVIAEKQIDLTQRLLGPVNKAD